MSRSRSRGRLKAPQALFVESSESSSEIDHALRIFDTINCIRASSKDIERGRHKERLPASTLNKVSTFSKSLWGGIRLLPVPAVLTLQTSLRIYETILFDIQQILNSDDPPEISDDIDRRLDNFMLQFREALDHVEGTINQKSSPGSADFFPNAQHFAIFGGNFNNNPVLHDPVVREQCENILQVVIFIKRGVLFF